MPGRRPSIADTMRESIERSEEEYYVSNPSQELLKKQSQINSTEKEGAFKIENRSSPILRAYDEGMMPPAHQRVYNALRDAAGGIGKSGAVILQRICESTKTSRTNVLRVIKYLEQYGFVKYEARPKEHCSFVSVLK